MTTNFLYAQAPNRKGNISKHTATGVGGATAVTAQKHGTATPKGNQGAPKAGRDATCGNGQKVMLSRPADNYGNNGGYLNSSYLK